MSALKRRTCKTGIRLFFKEFNIRFFSTTGSLLMLASLIGSDGLAAVSADEFQDCPKCPVMVDLPAGRFLMGTAINDRLTDPRTGKPATNDGPQHEVSIDNPFAVGKYEVTVDQFAIFVAATGYQTTGPCMEFSPEASFNISEDIDWDRPGFEQTGNAPVGCVSFSSRAQGRP